MSSQEAFILRIAPGREDRVEDALRSNQIIIGWSEAAELLDPSLNWEAFRDVVRNRYYRTERNLRKAGNAAGHLWRFIRDMKPGDLVVVPYGSEFYVAEVAGPATHDPKLVDDDTAFRRKVKWLNDKQPIPRGLARSSLQSRMKIQGTCAWPRTCSARFRTALPLRFAGRRRPSIRICMIDSSEKLSRRFDPGG